jgi:hypothetical protein
VFLEREREIEREKESGGERDGLMYMKYNDKDIDVSS